MTYIDQLLSLINEMSPYLLLGFLCAGILHVAVPRRFYHNYLSGNNFKSILYASLFGIPLPLCSCGVIPTAMSLRHEGASKGAVTAFLTSTPQTGVDSILATYSVFGLAFAIMRPVAALFTSFVSGALVNMFSRQNGADNPEKDGTLECASHKSSKTVAALRYGFVDMLQDIGGHLIIGLLIAGVIAVAVPDSFLVMFANRPLLEMAVVLLVSIPMYVCATGSIPIAAALMLKGLSPGAALVFLMAGPATNAASLMVIGKVLGRKTMWLYLAGIVAGAILFGLAIDYLLPAEWFSTVNSTVSCHTATVPLWKWISTAIFALLLINAMILKHITKNKKVMDNSVVYMVAGMTCNHCKMSIENALRKIDGVKEVSADPSRGQVTVWGDIAPETVERIVEELGFEFRGTQTV